MRQLSTFLRKHTEPILNDWEAFARSLPHGEDLDVEALRDHANDMLCVIADDLDAPQTAKEETDKSKGESDAKSANVETAAQQHGAGRAESGFTAGQMIAEFRALRASVLRLWRESHRETTASDLTDIIRFNEAIDQAIAESITRYTADVGQSTERFLAILGHDLRNPVGAVMTSTSFMLDHAAQTGDLPQPYLSLIEGVSRSGKRMNQMVADLLEFARVSFGQAIPIKRAQVDIEGVIRDVVAEVRASNPASDIKTEFVGDLCGEWDRDRLSQVLTNLVGNAVQHGGEGTPVSITARGDRDSVTVAVCNAGPTMTQEQIGQLFQGMNGAAPREGRDRRHLGLGLYIVDKIVTAHGGNVDVQSNAERGTTFTVRLPRKARATKKK